MFKVREKLLNMKFKKDDEEYRQVCESATTLTQTVIGGAYQENINVIKHKNFF